MKKIALLTAVTFFAGCTAIDVKQVDSSHQIDHVCFENNPKVIVADFVSTVEDVFHDHHITTEVYSGRKPEHCNFKLTYTALRSWDFSPYLSHAELRLFKGRERIGYAEYHLNGGGGFALNKWASVESKMTPVVNQLLAQYK
ncbi:Sbal_3080 family lipoprotein [Microbulbifer bruguierae]|uniref:Sbal_3080 family lipoprotein n=1 Tax=Microbulbifer bruguierae TaxID=3029061 RepID=A0ABY8NDH7_9GAMM|nr:Sbal_3080 family lipoprotein [Microbulbifer bruguierae]WGL16971.1 Sbal_3080 family lipoprotein [Microbulbifer bruguierae]